VRALWVVHRLDAATSGVVVFARNGTAARALSRAFQEQLVEKRYVALVSGGPRLDEGRIDAAIEVIGGRARVSERGKPASTSWRVLSRGRHDALLELEPRTGRMHQLRVHLASIGHPIAGDRVYGGSAASRLMLHAERIRFPHPKSGEPVEIVAAPPPELGPTRFNSPSLQGEAPVRRSRETRGR
jgi:tRNA pseudouridine32 synthase/23S rRNA pseudouridine746 synthase